MKYLSSATCISLIVTATLFCNGPAIPPVKSYAFSVWHPYLLDSINVSLNIDSSFILDKCNQYMIEEHAKCLLFQSPIAKIVLNYFILNEKVSINKNLQHEGEIMYIQIKDAYPEMKIGRLDIVRSSKFEGVALQYHNSETYALNFRGVNNEFQTSVDIYIETSDPELELKTQLIQILNSMHIWRGK